MAFVRLIELGRCPVNKGMFTVHGDAELAVFRLGDGETVVVTDNACPHRGGNLSGGTVTGDRVACPWHEWEFDLTTGACVHSDKASVKRYPAEVRGGVVYADLDAHK